VMISPPPSPPPNSMTDFISILLIVELVASSD
jgi:hypothetical protein